MKEFLVKAQTEQRFVAQNAYVSTEEETFIDVCGNKYTYNKVPVIPVLHVKRWQKTTDRNQYLSRMKHAIQNISDVLSSQEQGLVIGNRQKGAPNLKTESSKLKD